MNSNLADKLMKAASAEAFLREQNGATGWHTVSALKTEVDQLVGRDLNVAARLTERIEQVASLVDDPVARAFAEASRARVLHHAGSYPEANALYDGAIRAMHTANLKTEAAVIQMQRVYALTQMGRYQEALDIARVARPMLARGTPAQLAQLETNVGNIYYLLDRYKKALTHYDRARAILSDTGDDSMRALVDFSRSNVLTEMDRPEEALSLLESAASRFDHAGQALKAAQVRFHLAYLQFLRGRYNVALTGYYQERDKLAELGSPQLVAWCNLELAEILLALNSFDDAAENASAARARFTEIGMPYESARSAMVHALAKMGLGQLDQAQDDLTKARETFAADSNTTFTALADSYLTELALRRGDAAEAALRASSALRVFSRQKLQTRAAHSRLLGARAAYMAGDLARAARQARAALQSVKELYAPAIRYQCHHLIGRIDRDRNRRAPALESFRRAVKTIDEMRGGVVANEFKASFVRDKMEVYEDAITACLDGGGDDLVEEAFRLVESAKSRSLAELLSRYVRDASVSPRPAGRGLTDGTRERLQKLIEDLNWYSSQAGLEDDKGSQRSADIADRYRRTVMRCERQIAQLFRRLEGEEGDFAEIQRPQAATSTDLCGALEPGETAIEYFTAGDQISAFIASRDRIRVARNIASKREVERMLASLRFQIEKFNYGSDYVEIHLSQLKRTADERLAELYKAIFSPLEAELSGNQLVIIPHGALHYVPFHALRDGAGYLVDRFEISYAPSAAVLKLCRARRKRLHALRPQVSDPRVRISGKVAGDGPTLVALGVPDAATPSIEDEIRTLGAIFPNGVKLVGEQATRENLLRAAPGARFLHLASHGYFRRDNPMFSFLKLADSHLNFYSLLDLKLNAEMVTLSACHTGVNMVFPGDELHGLMRGFLYAGAPSLVVSLWAVSDRSTAELMREMYSRIRAGVSKREALRQAQLSIKDAYGHPYYWAPFVLMGDPG